MTVTDPPFNGTAPEGPFSSQEEAHLRKLSEGWPGSFDVPRLFQTFDSRVAELQRANKSLGADAKTLLAAIGKLVSDMKQKTGACDCPDRSPRASLTLHNDGRLMLSVPFGNDHQFYRFVLDDSDDVEGIVDFVKAQTKPRV